MGRRETRKKCHLTNPRVSEKVKRSALDTKEMSFLVGALQALSMHLPDTSIIFWNKPNFMEGKKITIQSISWIDLFAPWLLWAQNLHPAPPAHPWWPKLEATDTISRRMMFTEQGRSHKFTGALFQSNYKKDKRAHSPWDVTKHLLENSCGLVILVQ